MKEYHGEIVFFSPDSQNLFAKRDFFRIFADCFNKNRKGMYEVIKIRKGLDIKLLGEAEKVVTAEAPISAYAVKPTDFVGLVPKLMVSEGDAVKAGTPLFCDKNDERILFVSPVSGTVTAIVRGEKRAVQEVVIRPGEERESEDFGIADPLTLDRSAVSEKMLAGGVWTYLRQRPFGIVPDPDTVPRDIVISGFDTAPLAPDYDLLLHGKGLDFQTGLNALSRLTSGKVYLNLNREQNRTGVLRNSKNVEITYFEGRHPAGNVGTQINRLCPINKGDVVYFANPQDIVTIGHLFNTGHYRPEKIVAFAGECVKRPKYYRLLAGANIEGIAGEQVEHQNPRFISGNVLTGTKIEKNGFLGHFDNQITVIPEGDDYEFMGWLAPGFSKFSFSHTFLSGFLNHLNVNKRYGVNTNVHGGKRALVFTGEFEKVFPMNIYPMQLLKACIIGDIEQMEELGIYEVEPEDFALCEFIDTSKTDIQQIIRESLEALRKENS